jgi:uncharacterized protein
VAEISAELLALLVCPKCRNAVTVVNDEVHCQSCALAYPIKDGIPVMLVDQARDLESGDVWFDLGGRG